MAKKTFNIEVTMEERWVPHFLSMLQEMENLGNVGSSRLVTMYADGDGDFRPKFKPDIEFDKQQPREFAGISRVYDAG